MHEASMKQNTVNCIFRMLAKCVVCTISMVAQVNVTYGLT